MSSVGPSISSAEEILLKGTVNLVLPYNNGFLVGVDARTVNMKTKRVITNWYQKMDRIGDLVVTTAGSVAATKEVCDVLRKKVKENEERGVKTTVDMAVQYADHFVKWKCFERFGLYIVGMQDERLKAVYFVSDRIFLEEFNDSNEDTVMSGQNESAWIQIDGWKAVGTLCIPAIETVNKELIVHGELLTEEAALLLARKFFLISSLQMSGIGGHITICKVESTGNIQVISRQTVMALYVYLYDHVRDIDEEKNSVFLLTHGDVTNSEIENWFRSGSTYFPALKTYFRHKIGVVREGFTFRRVVIEGVTGAEFYAAVVKQNRLSCFPNACFDEVIRSMPYLHISGSLVYFAQASKKLLEVLHDGGRHDHHMI